MVVYVVMNGTFPVVFADMEDACTYSRLIGSPSGLPGSESTVYTSLLRDRDDAAALIAYLKPKP